MLRANLRAQFAVENARKGIANSFAAN